MVLCGACGRNARVKSEQMQTQPPIVRLCESLDYTDTAFLHSEDAMKKSMTDIIRLMMRSDSASISLGLDKFFRGLEGDPLALRHATHYAYLYLGNPNSSVRDETLYLYFLSALLHTDHLPEDIYSRAKEQERRFSLNRPGTPANDFRYLDRDGKEGSLYAIKSPQTLLVFYDPECPHCPAILNKIATDRKVNAAIKEGTLKVLAVYTEGKTDIWEKTKSGMPEQWTVAYDRTGVLDSDLYDLPAMPIVYLLDADKRVLVKDMAW